MASGLRHVFPVHTKTTVASLTSAPPLSIEK